MSHSFLNSGTLIVTMPWNQYRVFYITKVIIYNAEFIKFRFNWKLFFWDSWVLSIIMQCYHINRVLCGFAIACDVSLILLARNCCTVVEIQGDIFWNKLKQCDDFDFSYPFLQQRNLCLPRSPLRSPILHRRPLRPRSPWNSLRLLYRPLPPVLQTGWRYSRRQILCHLLLLILITMVRKLWRVSMVTDTVGLNSRKSAVSLITISRIFIFYSLFLFRVVLNSFMTIRNNTIYIFTR